MKKEVKRMEESKRGEGASVREWKEVKVKKVDRGAGAGGAGGGDE